MVLEHREQGETRQQILQLLRRNREMTAAELSVALNIGAVGVRQHLALLERDGLVQIATVRRGVGRPSHLYTLTDAAHELFPKRYDRLALDALKFVDSLGGEAALDHLFHERRARFAAQYRPQLEGKPLAEQIAELASILNEQGYMCDWQELADGTFFLHERNCPIDCVAREYHQACTQEIALYEDVLGVSVTREETIAAGGNCCRYHIGAVQTPVVGHQ